MPGSSIVQQEFKIICVNIEGVWLLYWQTVGTGSRPKFTADKNSLHTRLVSEKYKLFYNFKLL